VRAQRALGVVGNVGARPSPRPLKADSGRVALVLGPLFLLLLVWVWLLIAIGAFAGGPNGNSFGTDFAIYMGGARTLQDGRTPYNHTLLLRTERAYLTANGIPQGGLPRDNAYSRAVIRLGNPPLLFWALQPLTRLPFQVTAIAWMVSLYALMAAAFLCVLRYFGWQHTTVPLLLFLPMPQVLLGAYYGNVDCLVFAAVGIAFGFLRRYPLAAGALLTACWLKPQVALPIALLIILFHPRERARLALGFGATSAALFFLTLATVGWAGSLAWFQSFTQYSANATLQSDIPTLSSLYGHWIGGSERLFVATSLIVAALAVTATFAWKLRNAAVVSAVSLGWLWFVWFLVAPYAHLHDEIILVIPILALLGRDGSRATHLVAVAAPYLMFLSVVPLAIHPDGLNLLCLPILAAGICLWLGARKPWAPAA
jgi:Glycosyltransferase family 87